MTLTFVNQLGQQPRFHRRRLLRRIPPSPPAPRPAARSSFAGHETKSITLTPRAGTYPAHCSHFMHSMFGMKDEIEVR